MPIFSAARLPRTYATPSDSKPTPDQKPPNNDSKSPAEGEKSAEGRNENKDVQAKEGEQKEEPLKGLEGFFQRYHQGKGEEPAPGAQEDGAKKQQGRQESSNNRRNKKQEAPPGAGNQFNPNQLALLATTAAIFFALSSSSYPSAREITWQEFRTAFLDKGLVDSLTVVNRTKVRVKLHSNATGTMYPAAAAGGEYFFSIGSVEAFERKPEVAQHELGIP